MKNEEAIEAAHSFDKNTFGFWIYLMTDLLMFAVLFATYAVLHNNTFGGPSSRELFSLPSALIETLILLTSSFTCGLAILAVHRNDKAQMMYYFLMTFILGISFLWLEVTEFRSMIAEGHSFQTNAFLSSFFTLVGTHGLHITFGLIWMAIMMVYVLIKGLNHNIARKLTLLSLFWHFLDIVWIFIFTIVYLMGSM
jgi:cytochrome o ubiquinol oxidase subunit 3